METFLTDKTESEVDQLEEKVMNLSLIQKKKSHEEAQEAFNVLQQRLEEFTGFDEIHLSLMDKLSNLLKEIHENQKIQPKLDIYFK